MGRLKKNKQGTNNPTEGPRSRIGFKKNRNTPSSSGGYLKYF